MHKSGADGKNKQTQRKNNATTKIFLYLVVFYVNRGY